MDNATRPAAFWSHPARSDRPSATIHDSQTDPAHRSLGTRTKNVLPLGAVASPVALELRRQPRNNMNKTNCIKLGFKMAGVLALVVLPARADIFGSGANTFTITFASIGNPGNADDTGAGGGVYSAPFGGVAYTYGMATYEVSFDQMSKAAGIGGASGHAASDITWYSAAAFANWLNTSTGHHAAYNLNGNTLTLWTASEAWQAGGQNLYRHKDAFYFLPSEDEWYKAAYHKNDGVTANYWDYATGSNTAPTAVTSGTGVGTAVYTGATSDAANIDQAGGPSPYGTLGQNGNVYEWMESAFDGSNSSPTESRVFRGGSWGSPVGELRPAYRLSGAPGLNFGGGFRVASVVPEPSSALLLLGFGMMILQRRRRASAL